MPAAVPLPGSERRTVLLRATLVLSLFLGLLASAPVWRNARDYPVLPVAPWVPVPGAPWDALWFALLLAALLATAWRYRPAVVVFLGAALFAWAQDQHRGQPWFYLYCVMLGFTVCRTETALAAGRWALTAVYFWGGVQKLNPAYFAKMPDWFVEPMAGWPVPAALVTAMRLGIVAAPWIEIAFAVGFWLPRARLATLLALTALHLNALLLLGPLGHDYNWVVWPWNLAMVALAWLLFWKPPGRPTLNATAVARALLHLQATKASRKSEASAPMPELRPYQVTDSLRTLARSPIAALCVALFALLPALSFRGGWDSSFSFCLYSENQAVANVFVSPAFVARLPDRLKRYVREFGPYEPTHQGPFLFEFQRWCMDDLRVPAFNEPRGFRGMFAHLRRYAPQPHDLRMLVAPRAGPVLFWEGERQELLERQ